jgi:hypothetical protein
VADVEEGLQDVLLGCSVEDILLSSVDSRGDGELGAIRTGASICLYPLGSYGGLQNENHALF